MVKKGIAITATLILIVFVVIAIILVVNPGKNGKVDAGNSGVTPPDVNQGEYLITRTSQIKGTTAQGPMNLEYFVAPEGNKVNYFRYRNDSGDALYANELNAIQKTLFDKIDNYFGFRFVEITVNGVKVNAVNGVYSFDCVSTSTIIVWYEVVNDLTLTLQCKVDKGTELPWYDTNTGKQTSEMIFSQLSYNSTHTFWIKDRVADSGEVINGFDAYDGFEFDYIMIGSTKYRADSFTATDDGNAYLNFVLTNDYTIEVFYKKI